MHAKRRPCPSKTLVGPTVNDPLSLAPALLSATAPPPDTTSGISHNINFPSPLALATRPCSMPTAFTGPSCPRNVQCSASVSRRHTQISASFELGMRQGGKKEERVMRTVAQG